MTLRKFLSVQRLHTDLLFCGLCGLFLIVPDLSHQIRTKEFGFPPEDSNGLEIQRVGLILLQR
ncbi:hypothetical protein PAMC26510_08930 [Caballeronia sordidicola]|uniref:Uncharacterized protein n=1 Tax=Caballeronia sordidicola TaxID=196367 RepID=A0A242N0W9_CABSO|nr:hypothetical protein PAMC26510_08930 [Caballeronia sordidicola]